jgi:hypothetical protein
MNDRDPDYIKIYNTIVDLSQVTGIERGYVQLVLRMYIGKDVAFTFTFDDEKERDRIMGNIENHIGNNNIDDLMEDKNEEEEE